MRLALASKKTTGCRAALVLGVTLAAPGCTNRDVQVAGESGGEGDTPTGDGTTERDTNSDGQGTDESSDGADSTSGPSGTTSSSGGDESSGSTGEPDDVCENGRSAAPCGPAALPCSAVADEVIDETPRIEYWAPVVTASVDCDPQVHYTTLWDPMEGHLAARNDDGTWSSEPTPFAWGLQLERDEQGEASVAIGGEDSRELWTWDGRWSLQTTSPVDTPWHATAAGPEGRMYLATLDEDSLELHTWDPEMPGAFTTALIDEGMIASGLGVGGGTTGTVAWWRGTADGWMLQRSDGGPPEVVDAAFPGVEIAVADGGEHVLYTASAGLGTPTELRYAQRLPSGEWSVSGLITDDPDGVTCDQMPGGFGDTCDYDYTRVRAQDIVTSDDGDVRILFTEDHFVGQAVASTDCPGPGASPIPLPFWWCPEGTITTRLFVGWPDDAGGVAFESVSEEHRLRALDADLDAGGGINIAALVNDEDDNVGTSIRYMRLR